MEGNTNWKPNEEIRESVVNNSKDWRSQLELDIRKQVLYTIVEKWKRLFPKYSQNQINDAAVKFEENVYGMAKDKSDYIRKILTRTTMMDKISTNVKSGSSINGTNTPDPAQVLKGQSLPTSISYTQTPTRKQRLPQNIQSSLNIPGSSGFPTQVTITAQNVNSQMGEGFHSSLLPGSQTQMKGRQYMVKHQLDQQLLKEKIPHGDLRPPHMQHQAQPPQQQQSLLKQPIQQSFPHSSAQSSLQSSGQQTFIQQNSQFLPRLQFPEQWIRSSHRQQMVAPSQEHKPQEQEQIISQLMNGPDRQQNHLTSLQNNREQQKDFRVSLSQQNNIASFQAMAQQNNNLQNMHLHRLSTHNNNVSALPSQQQQNMPCDLSGTFNVPGSSLLGTQGQHVGQTQPMMYQPQHPEQQKFQNRTLQQHLDYTQWFQAAGSLCQTQNIADQQNQPYQNPSTFQDSISKTVNACGRDWQEETYKKIKALKEMYLPDLSTMLQKVMDKLRQVDSLPQQKILYEPTEKLRAGKSTLEQVIVFLNVHRSGISEKHRDRFTLYEEQVLRLTKNQTVLRRPRQQQKVQLPPTQNQQTALQSQSLQVDVPQSLENDQKNSRLMHSNQNGASSLVSGSTASQTVMPHLLQTRPKMELGDENNVMASLGNVVLPSLKQNLASNQQVIQSNISSVQSNMFQQFHHRQMQQQQLHRQQQQQQLQANQQLQMATSHQTNALNDLRMRQGINIKDGFLQHLSSSQHELPKPLASPAQIQNHSPPQLVDQQNFPGTVNKTGTSTQSRGSPFVASSPLTSFPPSPVPGDPENPISVESPVLHDYQFQTEAQSPSCGVATKSTLDPPFTLPPEPIPERPIDRLIKAFQSSSPKSLAESVSEMSSVISMADMITGSFDSIVEDLSARTKFRLQGRNLTTDGEKIQTNRLKRSISALPLDITSQNDRYKHWSSLECEAESTASSGSKINKIKAGFALLQEIKEINWKLIETVVDICDEDVHPSEVTLGTIVTCSYSPVALCDTFKALYKSGQLSQIQPLRLLVPENYPYSSPILVEKIPFDARYEDLSARARSRFSLSVKELSEPMSLKEIAQTWNDCARATMTEYAERHGGGTFSSTYGTWETVLRDS